LEPNHLCLMQGTIWDCRLVQRGRHFASMSESSVAEF
jgi:hypothetical protein